MHGICTYVIELGGQVDQVDVNVMSPVSLSLLHVDSGVTRLCARTDQSGLIGLLRHLHGLGFTLLSVHCES